MSSSFLPERSRGRRKGRVGKEKIPNLIFLSLDRHPDQPADIIFSPYYSLPILLQGLLALRTLGLEPPL